MKLLPKQNNALYFLRDNETNEIIYGGAAGGGKSAFGCLWLIEQCQKYPGSRWLMGRSKLKTLKETTLNTFFEISSRLQLTDQFNYNQQTGVITFNNGSEIILKDLFLYPSDPNFDSLGSLEITGAFVDECNQIVYKAWQIVKSRIRYKLNEFGIVPKILGTCNPSKNWVYTEFYQPNKKRDIKEYRKFVQALPTDNPHLPKTYLQSLLELDEVSKQRLYYGSWEYDNDPAKLIEFDNISNIFTNDFVEKGDRFITADIARFGSDKAVIMVWSGLRVIFITEFAKSAVTQLAQTIKELSTKHSVPLSNIIVDEDGVGGGVVDVLNCKGFVNNSKALPEDGVQVQYQNLKSQCYFHLARKINANEVYIQFHSTEQKESIIQELEQVKRDKIDSDGKLSILPKEKVKELLGRSPDYADTLMMRMFFELEVKDEILIF